MGHPLTLETAGTSWENWQKPAKVKKAHQSQLSQMSLYGGWLKEGEDNISRCPFFPKFRLAGKYIHIISSSPMDSHYLLVCVILCPENLAWQLPG